MKKILFFLVFISITSCNKDDDNSERQLTPNHENFVGDWEYTSIIRSNGAEEQYPHRCSTSKDYSHIVLNTTITSHYYYQDCATTQWNCNNYFFEGNRIRNCFPEFDDARVTSLTASTMRLEYDEDRNFGAITGNVRGLILKKR
ncbi:MAG: hypothetical protein J0L86_04900 [Flavobacteriales bacterium]|nr:hypothetical protein [Flavobacteriales bacterium]